MIYRILVASYSNEVYTLAFDSETPSLTLTSTVTVGHHPSWITPHPTDKNIVFTALEKSEGQIIVLKLDAEGRATVVGQGPSGGDDPCTLLALEDQLLLGNYSSGTFAAVPLSAEPPYIASAQSTIIPFTGTGPNKERQESSHLHQVIAHPAYKEVFVPDLGADQTRRLVRGPDGKWAQKGAISYKAGAGPRHVAFYEGVVYTLFELTSEVSAHRVPALPSEPVLLDTTATMANPPASQFDADMLASEILVPAPNASFPAAHVYVSNRNDPDPEGDTIAIFITVGADDKIGYVTEVRSGLQHLRGMVFGGPDDKYLVAGGVHGGGVKMFERVDGGKGLTEIASIDLKAPTGFLWL